MYIYNIERERESTDFTETGVFVYYALSMYRYLGNLIITAHTDSSRSSQQLCRV